ncbi:MAG: hypothetical protein QNK04_28320 [Myxococcota bacterium]|nr:hypothetical protein [Myxococcota bacterium]
MAADRSAPRGQLGAALAVACLSGAAALWHELLWTRRMVDLLGASGESSARVFGCFFLGLALGAALSIPVAARTSRPWRAVAVCEVGVAVLAVPFLTLELWTAWIWPALGPEGLTGVAGRLVKLALSAALVAPPALLMGMVLPLMARAVIGAGGELARAGVWLYGLNTLGGVVGLGTAALVALPALGVSGALLGAMATNAVVAAGALALDLRRDRSARPDSQPRPRSEGGAEAGARELPLILAVGFFSGAAVLAVEVVGLQMVMLGATLSFYAPSAILAGVILALGCSALAAPALARRAGGASRLLPFVLAVAALATAAGPESFMALSRHVVRMDTEPHLALWLSKLFALVALSLGPGFLAAGLVFPLATAWLGSEAVDPTGRRWGWLLAANGVGGVVGAELGHRLLLPELGAYAGIGLVAVGYGVVGAGLAAVRESGSRGTRWARGALALAPATAAVVALVLTLGPLQRIPHVNPHAGFTVYEELRGREGVLSVVGHPDLGRALLVSNQYLLGSSSAGFDQERLGHLPLLLHRAPRRVAFLGLATGSMPAAALEHEAVESVVAVELSPLVVEASAKWFSDENRRVAENPRARIVIEDARTYVAAARGRFDVIVGDLFLPWGPGEARLYSEEHFLAVREALAPGGVYCQWLAMYQLAPEDFEMIAASLLRAFPVLHLVRSTFQTEQPALALCGLRDGELDWGTVEERARQARDSGVRDPVVRHAEGLALLYLGTVRRGDLNGTQLNTLGNAALELRAGRERVTGQPGQKYYFGRRWVDFVVERTRARSREPGERWDVATLGRLGAGLTEWEEARRIEHERTEALLRPLQRRIPEPIRADEDAKRSRWPGDPRMLSPP